MTAARTVVSSCERKHDFTEDVETFVKDHLLRITAIKINYSLSVLQFIRIEKGRVPRWGLFVVVRVCAGFLHTSPPPMIKSSVQQTEAHSFCGISFYYSVDSLSGFTLTRSPK